MRQVEFFIENESSNSISSYDFLADIYGEEFKISSYKNLEPYSIADVSVDIASNEVTYKPLGSNVVSKANFEKIKKIKGENVKFKTVDIMSTDGKYLINNNGTQRIIAVFAPSFVLGLVGFLEIIKTKWLRMFFKFCGMRLLPFFQYL